MEKKPRRPAAQGAGPTARTAPTGLTDERAGEVPVAVVHLRPDVPVAEDELQQFVANSLATYKHLRRIVIVDTIPRLPSGKVLRRALRDEWTPLLLEEERNV